MAGASQSVPAQSSGGPEQAAARSRVFGLLAQAFRYPTADLAQRVAAGAYRTDLEAAAAPVVDGGPGVDWKGLAVGSVEELEQRYMETFDVGGPEGPPCFLYEGEYGGGRTKVMEDILRFYHFFGLRLSEEQRDRPDHLATELEFLHFLAYREWEAAVGGRAEEATAYGRAARDFLAEHAADLVAEVHRKLQAPRSGFYPGLAAVADSCCRTALGRAGGGQAPGGL